MRTKNLVGNFALLGWLFAACAGAALADDLDARQILAPTGTLRAGLYPGTPTSILPGAEPRGIGYEIGKELAKQLGVAYEPVVFPNNAGVQAAIAAGNVDVAFTNASAARAKVVDSDRPTSISSLAIWFPRPRRSRPWPTSTSPAAASAWRLAARPRRR